MKNNPTSPSASPVTVEHLSKKYNDHYALRDISFSLFGGDILGIIGPNGAGKTTTIEIIEGIRKPTSGKVRVFGENPFMNRNTKSKINASLQGNSFFYDLTVKDILRMYSVLYSSNLRSSKERLNQTIEEFKFEKILKTKYKNLSGGQKQRLSLAIAFINDATLLFLDEPTEGLDPISRNHMWEIIKQRNSEGKTILITSHYMEEIEKLCNRVVFINRGEIVEQGYLSDVLDRYKYSEVYEVEFSKGVNIKILQALFRKADIHGVKTGKDNNGYLLFIKHKKQEDIIETLSKISKNLKVKITSYKLKTSKLEDIYIKLIR